MPYIQPTDLHIDIPTIYGTVTIPRITSSQGIEIENQITSSEGIEIGGQITSSEDIGIAAQVTPSMARLARSRNFYYDYVYYNPTYETFEEIIPLELFDIKAKIINEPFLKIGNKIIHCMSIPIKYERTDNSSTPFSKLKEERNFIKKYLEEYINKNYTHIFKILEKKNRLYTSTPVVNYILTGAKIKH